MQYWEPVTGKEADMIHNGACEMLEDVGIRIQDENAISVLCKAGAIKVDERTVKLPQSMVEKAIESAPERFELYDRNGGSMTIGDGIPRHLAGATMT